MSFVSLVRLLYERRKGIYLTGNALRTDILKTKSVQRTYRNMTVLRFIAWIKLGRFLFLGGGFVFFALGASIAHYQGQTIDWMLYFIGQLTVTTTQLMVHYSNDYFDYHADLANKTATRWSGGSRILPSGQLLPRVALYTALTLALVAVSLIILLITQYNIHSITILLLVTALVLSWGYSAPPMRLHSRGLGEIAASFVVPVLTPFVSYSLQTGNLDVIIALAIVPLALLQFNMLLTVHLPDMEGDSAVNKRTLVVILGRRHTIWLYQAILIGAYLLAPLLILAGLPVQIGLGVVLPIPLALWLFWRMKLGHGSNPEHWERLAFWSIGLLMGTGVVETGLFFILS